MRPTPAAGRRHQRGRRRRRDLALDRSCSEPGETVVVVRMMMAMRQKTRITSRATRAHVGTQRHPLHCIVASAGGGGEYQTEVGEGSAGVIDVRCLGFEMERI